MKTEQLIAGIAGAVIGGFLFGVGFELAKRTMNRNRQTATTPTTTHSNYVETSWSDNKWLTDEMNQALDSTNGLNQDYFGANGWQNVNAPQPFRPNPKGIDFTTGRPKW